MIPKAEATRSSGGFHVFEIDPAEFEQPIEVVWRTSLGMRRLAGPILASRLRDVLAEGKVREAGHLAKGARRAAPAGERRAREPSLQTPPHERYLMLDQSEWSGLGSRDRALGGAETSPDETAAIPEGGER